MTQRGRKSAAEMAVAPPPSVPNRPDPPAGLAEAEAALWRATVAEKPAGWFDAASQPLLAEYCRACVLADDLEARAVKLGKKWLEDDRKRAQMKLVRDMQDKQRKIMATLATKLRLAQQSRYGPRAADTAARDAAKPKLWEVSGG